MANIRTYEIKFAHLSEYSSPISVYSESLLQPISISVGYWFATGSGTVSLLASYDNSIYNSVYSTTAFNNSVIYLSLSSFVGSFVKIQRSTTELVLSGALVNNATASSSTDTNIVIFSSPQNIQINDEIIVTDTASQLVFDEESGLITFVEVQVPLTVGISQQSASQSFYCQFAEKPLDTKVNLPLSIVRRTPLANGLLTCTFIEPSIVSLDINY